MQTYNLIPFEKEKHVKKYKGCGVGRHRGRVVTFRVRFWAREVNNLDSATSQMADQAGRRGWMHFNAKGTGSGEEEGCEGTAPLRLWVN